MSWLIEESFTTAVLNSKAECPETEVQTRSFLPDNAGFSVTELPIPGCINCTSETLDFCWITASSDLSNSQFPKHRISSGKCVSLSVPPGTDLQLRGREAQQHAVLLSCQKCDL